MIKNFFLVFIALSSFSAAHSQNYLSNYKYVIVPTSFKFLKKADQYSINSLTKFLFNKNKFQALMVNEKMPVDFDNCLALYADVLDNSGMFRTKLTVQLKDCNGVVVFSSKEGTTLEKQYEVAYNIALREAFNSIKELNYKYIAKDIEIKSSELTASKVYNEDIKKLKDELKALKLAQKAKLVKSEAVDQTKLKDKFNTGKPKEDSVLNTLYAQAITNGFQLVDNSPKVIFKIKNTSLKDVFLVEGEEATIYRLDGNWIMEFYENGTLKTKVLNIKF